MLSTMQDFPLTISAIFRHGRSVFGQSEVVTFEGESCRRASFAQVAERADQLAAALSRLGIREGDRVGTFAWNNQEHLEAYLAVPSMGAVLHTLNLRLFPEQLTYVVNHAEDQVVIVDGTVIPLLARVASELKTVEQFIVVGEGDDQRPRRQRPVLRGRCWPPRRPATTSPRSTNGRRRPCATRAAPPATRRALSTATAPRTCTRWPPPAATTFGLTEADRILPIVPMFHANAWGLPYAGWMTGSDFVMPNRFLQGEPLCKLIDGREADGVRRRPHRLGRHPAPTPTRPRTASTSPRCGWCPAAARPSPGSLMEAFEQRHGVRIIQAWGMTETSARSPPWPTPPRSAPRRRGHGVAGQDGPGHRRRGAAHRRRRRHRPALGRRGGRRDRGSGPVDHRLATTRSTTPRSSTTAGCGPATSASVEPNGFVQITDRAKDVIKSGGEWISSVELEDALMGHPDVKEAAVVGVPDERWDERPLACVVLKEGESASVDDLKGFLAEKVAKWWLPERWSFIDEVPEDLGRQVRQEGAPGPLRRRRARGHRGLGAKELPDAGRHVVLTISTSQAALWAITSGTLPSLRWVPRIPLLPTTIRSARSAFATSRMAVTGS